MNFIKALFLFLLLSGHVTAQLSSQVKDSTANKKSFPYTSLIIPAGLIAYGIIGVESDQLKYYNSELKEELNENIDEKLTVDDFSQYSPFLSVYALNAFGVKGKHNFRERTVILSTAYLLMGATVFTLKSSIHEMRPDNSSDNSFPSGHTATAFMGAEFLWQEYKDQSIWYGITGYVVAAGTGFFRMYNDRHWLTDVAAGAGIGMLSTKVAYWLHPFISNLLFKKKEHNTEGTFVPFYNGKQYGLGMAISF